MSQRLTRQTIEAAFGNSEDLIVRSVCCRQRELWLFAVDGLVSGSFISQYVLQPITERLQGDTMQQLYRNALQGQVYNSVAKPCSDVEDALNQLVNGFCVLLFPGVGAIAFETKTGEKRSISEPSVENTVKGAKDAFTETLRVNTGLLRRHLRTPELRLYGTSVGLRSRTYVTVVWIEGITDPELVRRMKQRLGELSKRDMLTPAAVEDGITGARATPFPLLQYTERTDKFAQGLLGGRVGLLVDGLPLGYLLPVDLGYLMYSQEDYGANRLTASFLRILRYGALLLSLLLPGCYLALVSFHHEMIPLPLLRSIVEAGQRVPFSPAAEVLALLMAFELLQEAGLHLPKTIGSSVSVIGGIVVGSAAVEAGLISAVALIAVSAAGICGYAQPNRDLAEAIRLCRLGLVLLGGFAGLFGICCGVLWLLCHLSRVESLGCAYLGPFADANLPGEVRSEGER